MSERLKELIAIHQLDTANLQARIDKNAPGTDMQTIENIVSYIEGRVLPELSDLFYMCDQAKIGMGPIGKAIDLGERSIILGFGYGMQYQDGMMLHKKLLTRFSSVKSPEALIMPDALQAAVKAIFRSVYAAFEQAIEEGMSKSIRKKSPSTK